LFDSATAFLDFGVKMWVCSCNESTCAKTVLSAFDFLLLD